MTRFRRRSGRFSGPVRRSGPLGGSRYHPARCSIWSAFRMPRHFMAAFYFIVLEPDGFKTAPVAAEYANAGNHNGFTG